MPCSAFSNRRRESSMSIDRSPSRQDARTSARARRGWQDSRTEGVSVLRCKARGPLAAPGPGGARRASAIGPQPTAACSMQHARRRAEDGRRSGVVGSQARTRVLCGGDRATTPAPRPSSPPVLLCVPASGVLRLMEFTFTFAGADDAPCSYRAHAPHVGHVMGAARLSVDQQAEGSRRARKFERTLYAVRGVQCLRLGLDCGELEASTVASDSSSALPRPD